MGKVDRLTGLVVAFVQQFVATDDEEWSVGEIRAVFMGADGDFSAAFMKTRGFIQMPEYLPPLPVEEEEDDEEED
jgi:hypothetical protein